MGKKVLINESMMKQLMVEEILSKADMASLFNSSDFKDAVKKSIKDDRNLEKELEEKVRKIVADSVNNLFKGLWEKNNFWKSIITHS